MCAFCGASQEVYERGEEFESYAYNFIHTNNPEKIFNMKFDVIVGNPPYQLSDGGSGTGISAKPIYQQFVKQAIKLNPLYLVFIIPSRWFAGGKGLDDFRNDFLNDKRLKYLVDFPKSRDCFPGVDVAGGVCYFLWDINHNGNCQVTSVINNSKITKLRILNEFDVFVRDNTGIDIINKIRELNSNNYSKFVFARNPFGFVSSERGSNKKSKDSIKLISSAGIGFVNRENVTRNASLINYYKVMIGKVNPDRGGVNNASDGKMNVITKVRLIKPNEVFTETYLLLGCFKTEKEAIRCCKFFSTKFVRFLISLTLSSMNITRDNFQFVPLESMDIDWDDPMFYLKYNLNESEVQYIETSIRLMGFSLSENIDE
jgi:site-specific DNA-methyltransferase (adenine-specific)